jgi:hypothetical protein
MGILLRRRGRRRARTTFTGDDDSSDDPSHESVPERTSESSASRHRLADNLLGGDRQPPRPLHLLSPRRDRLRSRIGSRRSELDDFGSRRSELDVRLDDLGCPCSRVSRSDGRGLGGCFTAKLHAGTCFKLIVEKT